MSSKQKINIQLNAQANIENIDKLKKQIEDITSKSNFGKGITNDVEKYINKLNDLQKVFTGLSKKTVLNDKDIEVFSKSIIQLENNYKNIQDVMKNISSIDLLKSTKSYGKYIEDLNKRIIELKTNFKDITGLDFDKEKNNIQKISDKIEILRKNKENLAKTGLQDEYNKLLDSQNQKLEKQKNKLNELKKLRNDISKTREEQIKSNGKYNNYEELQQIATTRVTKSQISTQFEQREIQKLNNEYSRLEKELEKIEKLKTKTAKQKRIDNLAKQLGIDNGTLEIIKKTIDQMKQMVSITAKRNVKTDSNVQKEINNEYNALLQAKKAAEEYLKQINLLSDSMVKQSNITGARTYNGLNNDINRIESDTSIGIDKESLMNQAKINLQDTNNANDSQLNQLINLLTQIVSTSKEIEKTNQQANNLEENIKSSLKENTKAIQNDNNNSEGLLNAQKTIIDTTSNIDNDTTAIETNTRSSSKENAVTTKELVDKSIEALLNIKENIDNSSNFTKINEDARNNLNEILPSKEEITKMTGGEIVNAIRDIISYVKKPSYLKDTREKLMSKYNEKSSINDKIIEIESNLENKNLFSEGYADDIKNLEILKNKLLEINTEITKLTEDYGVQEAIDDIVGKLGMGLQSIPDKIKIIATDIEKLEKNNSSFSKEEIEKNLTAYDEMHKATLKRMAALEDIDKILKSNIETTRKQAEEIKKANVAQDIWNNSIGQLGRYVATYASVGYILNQVFNRIKSGIAIVKEMDKSITQIAIVTNKTSQDVWKNIDTYINQAQRLHVTTTDLLNATKLYYQQGLNTAEVNKMVEATAIAAALGETDMAGAADTLTSIMNSYNLSAEKAIEVTDKISAVGADSAADFRELSTAIEKVASSAATAGLDLDHLMGYLGKMIEVTREAPTNVGTAMKTIVSRMAELKEDPTKALEDGTDLNKVETALKSVGIQLLDLDGNIRPLSDVIDELGNQWESLSRNHKAYLATVIAGNRQQSRFLALMNNYDRTLELVNSSQESAGRSAQQFRNYLTGTQASINDLKIEGEKFITQITKGNGAIKFFYKSLKGLMELANQLGPVMTGLTISIAGLGKNIFSSFSKNAKETIGNQIDSIIDSLNNKLKDNNFSDSINFQSLMQGTKLNNKSSEGLFNFFGGKKELEKFNKINNEYTNILKEINVLEEEKSEILDEATRKQIDAAIAVKQKTLSEIEDVGAITAQNIRQKILNGTLVKTIALQFAVSVGITALVAVIGLLVNKISDWNKAERESIEAAEERSAQLQEEYNSLETLANKYILLKEKVDLTEQESQDLKSVNDDLISQYPELIEGIDEQGNAYLTTTERLREFLKLKKQEQNRSAIDANNKKLSSKSTLLSGNQEGNKEILLTDFWGAKRKSDDAMGEMSKAAFERAESSFEDANKYKDFVEKPESKIDFTAGTVNNQVLGRTLRDQAKGLKTQEDFNKAYESEQEKFIKNLKEYYKIDVSNFEDYLTKKDEISEKIGVDNTEKLTSQVEGAIARKKASGDIQRVKTATMQDISSIAFTNFKAYGSNAITNDINYDDYGKDVENQLANIANNIIAQKQEEFGDNTAGYTEWVKNYQGTDFVDISKMLMEANKDKETNKKITDAFKNYNNLKKNGASKNDVDDAFSQYLTELENGLKDKNGTLSEENKQRIDTIKNAFNQQDSYTQQMAKQILTNIGKDSNNEDEVNNLVTKLNAFNNEQRNRLTSGIQSILQNSDLSEEERQTEAQKFINAVFGLLKNSGQDFRLAYDQLDKNNSQAVQDFIKKYKTELQKAAEEAGISTDLFIKSLLPDPGVNKVTEQQNLKNAYTSKNKIGEIDNKDLLSQDTTTSQIMNLDNKIPIEQTEMVGDKLIVSTKSVAENIESQSKKIVQSYKNISKSAEEELSQQEKNIEGYKDTIKQLEEKQKSGKELNDTEKQNLKTAKDSINTAQKQVSKLKGTINTYNNLAKAEERASKKEVERLKNNNSVSNQLTNVSQTIDSLKDLASTYDLVKNKQMSQLDIIQKIASDKSYLDYLQVENGQLIFSTKLMEDEAATRINEAEIAIDTEIAKLEAQQAYLDGTGPLYEEDFNNIGTIIDQYISAGEASGELATVTAENLQSLLGSTKEAAQGMVNSINSIIRAYNEMHKAEAGGDGQTQTADTSGSVNGADKKEMTVERKEFLKKNVSDQIAKLKAIKNQLSKYKTNPGSLFNDINNIGSSGGGGSSGGKDAYEATIEKLEHFYNYLRQIEALESKIEKIRNKRELIDATENYYIKDLIEENRLLKEQANLYGNYINDEVEYLATLRNQLSAAYGDWVYFNNDGIVQLKQTEFNINSEEEEKRYETFSELLDEYQNEYNTMLENQNKLYTIQSTIVENINSTYDKTLQKLNDITERLEYINSISEHRVNMEFGSIKKLEIMNNQIKTTADMLLYAQKSVNELEGDFNQLSKIVEESAFKSLLTWNETLQKYFVNNDALNNDNIRKQFEAQGYNWQDTVTWVNATAAASQKITNSIKETNEQLMSAREALKGLLDERLSTIDEIFNKATEEINKFYGIYEKKITSLGTENDLFGTKSENLEKQFDYLVTTAQHAKALLNDLKENNQSILDTLMKDYGQYIDMIDGVAYINKIAIEESNTLTERQKADLLQLYQLYYDSKDQIDEVNDKFYDYISQIKEMEEAKRDAIIDLKNQLYQELLRIDQKEIDDLREKYQKMNQLDSEYYSKLQQRINDARNARSRLQQQQNLTQMQNRLATLQQDNSGQYNSEMIELQKQINEQLQNQADQNVDLELERIAREQEQRQEDREMQITQMENLLTFKDENGIYWQETQDIIENGNASVIGKLMESEEIQKVSKEEQAKQFESLESQVETANADFTSIYQDEMGWQTNDIRQGLKDFVEAPLDKIPGEISSSAGQIKEQIINGTKTFINTMSALFKYLDELTGKTEAKGYTTGILNDSGIYTAPTKKPDPAPSIPAAPAAPPQSKPSLAKGSYVQVKSGTRWYYDSYGKNPSGRARSGTIKYINTKGSHPYNIEGLGWIKKTDIVGYNKGGYVDYTGIAAVHGKVGKPEAFLNAKQTALFETLRDALIKVPRINSKEENNSENITIENFTIDVKELADTDSIDKVVKTVKDSIYRDATSGNNMKINRRR